MSEPIHYTAPELAFHAAPPAPPGPPGPPAPPRPSRLWFVVTAAVTVLALAAGAAGAVSVLLVSGWRKPLDREYQVSVFLKDDITEAQRTAVQTELAKFPARDGVRFESRAEAFKRFEELWKDEQDKPQVEADDLPESFRLTVIATEFDCAPLRAVGALPGVNRPIVSMMPAKGRPGSAIACS
ncbi:permease-like cell division protein FtsX [Jidongwangia harbinensis]|uniref:permease-like cell division protein FtsX n=1 Tax=Jidongwangia harbinensis TaxID=2878561 RepID=UPI001CDA1965|nr:permease-like cell division protein FtsX [Jidongwangia harbinensis]MCA2219413.1 permease-like cell division protein FtsX [Jidongwangia harbinensis]